MHNRGYNLQQLHGTLKHGMIALSFYAAFFGGSEKTLKASFLFLLSMYVICGSYSGAVVSSFASRQKGPEFESNNIYDTDFTCSSCIYIGSLCLLPLPPAVQKHE